MMVAAIGLLGVWVRHYEDGRPGRSMSRRLADLMDLHSLDFAACHTAAVRFIREWCAVRAAADLVVVPGDTAGLPRLPCERLYLQP